MQKKLVLKISYFRMKGAKLLWCSNSGTAESFSAKVDRNIKNTR